MTSTPRWLVSQESFEHRNAIESLLAQGGSLRADSRIHSAGQLAGTYRIRLNIAQDPQINPAPNVLEHDLSNLVAGLESKPEAEVTAWFVRDSDSKLRLYVFEDREAGYVIATVNFGAGAPTQDAV